MSNSFGSARGPMTTPIPSPANSQTSNDDIFMECEDCSNGPTAAIEDVHPEIEDNDLALENLNPTIGLNFLITPTDGSLVVRNDTQRANVDQQRVQQVVEDDQPMVSSNAVPAPAQVSQAANKSNCGGRRRVQKPTEEDSPCEVAIKKCRVYKERPVDTTNNDNGDNKDDESSKKIDNPVVESRSLNFRQRNEKEENNLKKLKDDKQKDLDTERAALNMVVLSYKRIVDQFSSKIQHLHRTTLDLSRRQLKLSPKKDWDELYLIRTVGINSIKNHNLDQKMLDVKQLLGDYHVDPRGNNAIILEEEVARRLALQEAENPNKKTEAYWATISDEKELKKQKLKETNRIDGAKSRIRERLRKEILSNDIRKIWAGWDYAKEERQHVADIHQELRNKGTAFVDHAVGWIKYLQDVQVDLSDAARANIESEIADIRELFGQTQGPYQA